MKKQAKAMQWRCLAGVMVVLALAAGCANREAPFAGNAPSEEQRAAVEQGVRQFVTQVGQDVSREGPLAWKKEFASGPEFFMASEGNLTFANGQAAIEGIDGLRQIIKRIELHWGDDLRVDVLTPTLAVVGTSWAEDRDDVQGRQVKQAGYFTAVVEQRAGKWTFRDAHWSVPGEKISGE